MNLTKLLIFSFCGLAFLVWGCGTSNQATQPKQVYHDLTSRYNAHFNVNEKLKGVIKLSEQNHKDKFDSVIPVYYYSDPKEFASYSADLEDVIKRSTIAVQLHGISNWSDDHFILMGVANYLKGDYLKADNNFKYITTNYKDGVDYVKVMKSLEKRVGKYKRAKKKTVKPQIKTVVNKDGTTSLQKVDNRPEKTIWIHTPARSEALLWLIKTNTRQGKFEDAEAVLTYTKNDNQFYKNYDHELLLAEADLRVSQKRYKDAIAPLEKYLVSKKVLHRKKLRARPLFVLAQCYAAVGDNTHAAQKFSEVLKSHPNYDMEFYAKIKMAKMGRGSNDANDDVRTLLVKMSKDGKYKDYWDQVYYELALLSLSKKNPVEARMFLQKSIENSTNNDEQQALSYMTLAELDYEEEAYETAKLYYDSTLAVMPKNDSRYPELEERDKMLDNLVKQLAIIANEDSLQKLAALPKEQQQKIARQAILKKEQEEQDKKDEAAAAKQQQQMNNSNNLPTNSTQQQNTNTAGGWYFYNTTSRATGFNEFVKKWGKRKLEENWRRKNKATVLTDDDAATTTSADTAAAKKDSVQQQLPEGASEEDKLLAAVPNTPEQMKKSVGDAAEAYYTAGTIYKDGLDAYGKAENMFETLNSKYPGHKLLLESYYNLYLIALKQKDNSKAEKYKNLILTQFPESVIAKVLRDPNYLNEAKKKEQVADAYYQSAYEDYVAGRLDSAWYKCEMSNVVLKNNPYAAKFELLEALVLAKQNKLAEYIQALNKIINKSTDAQVKKAANDLLSALNRSSLPQVDLSKDPARRDSLNVQYPDMNPGKPDTSDVNMLRQMEEARLKAIKNGNPNAKVDTSTASKPQTPVSPTPTTTVKDTTTKAPANTKPADTTAKKASPEPVTPSAPTEDTTSPYTRGDETAHYFIIYFKDPAVPQSAIMSTMAKVNAYNSTQFSDKRLTAKQVIIDASNKLLRVNQFKNKADAVAYYKAMRSQSQLYTDMKPEQYALVVISAANMGTLLSLKDIDEYGKFFNRVYK